MATDKQQITLRVFVNKTQNCVAFVESDLDFVDVLLSFLTLPVATVVRLLDKQSSLGCFDNLYESVEQLDEKYLATATCRSMLTNPVNSSGVKCQKLRINIDETGELYVCTSAFICSNPKFSYYSSAKCEYGCGFDQPISYPKQYVTYDELHGVFIKGDRFAVTDALSIVTIEDAISPERWGNDDWSNLEQRSVKIERAQVLDILKRSLISDTPLTDVLLQNGEEIIPKFSVPPVGKTGAIKAFDKEKKIYRIKLALTQNKVLYAVASRDFVDVIFSFLTFPMGTLKKHLGSRFRIGSLNELYSSAERLVSLGYVVAGCEERLLNPKLAPHFNCKHQIIGVEEQQQDVYYACPYRCRISATSYLCISHPYNSYQAGQLKIIDPKRQHLSRSDSSCGSYCKELMYMVSDELVVTPLSLKEFAGLRKEFSEPVLKMAELGIGEEEALDLLSAASSSKTALTDAFFAKANFGGECELPH